MDETGWRKSTYSSNGGASCIEVGQGARIIAVRDTQQHGRGPVLRFTPAAWRRFADQVKRSLASQPKPSQRPLTPGRIVVSRETRREHKDTAREMNWGTSPRPLPFEGSDINPPIGAGGLLPSRSDAPAASTCSPASAEGTMHSATIRATRRLTIEATIKI